MELLALLAILLLWLFGWVLLQAFASSSLDAEERFYFAPALGLVGAGAVAYLGSRTNGSVVTLGAVAFLVAGVTYARLRGPTIPLAAESRRLIAFVLICLGLVYGMQLSILLLYHFGNRGPHEVWTIYNATGISPPDQMFSWHQAMFVFENRVYPRDPFYGDTDLYDRPHLGGYVVLFFFQLFRLPLTEQTWEYPAHALRFYHCLCWLINNLYLLGVGLLFKRLFGIRGAIAAVASTAAGGLFLLLNLGSWMKFGSAYPLLLALVLFLKGSSPVLQGILCAAGFHLHASVLPFLLAFGTLQIASIRIQIADILTPLKSVAWFAAVCAILIGGWFAGAKISGARQNLVPFFVYDATLPEANSDSLAQVVQRFYAKHSWKSLALLPVRNVTAGITPLPLLSYARQPVDEKSPLSRLASALFQSQQRSVLCAIGVIGFPLVLAGLLAALRRSTAAIAALLIYVLPTLVVALFYRKPDTFSLHILVPYHAMALAAWICFWRHFRWHWTALGILGLAVEGVVCVTLATQRLVSVPGLDLHQLNRTALTFLGVYLAMVIILLIATSIFLRVAAPPEATEESAPPTQSNLVAAFGRLTIGAAIIAGVLGLNALYYRIFL